MALLGVTEDRFDLIQGHAGRHQVLTAITTVNEVGRGGGRDDRPGHEAKQVQNAPDVIYCPAEAGDFLAQRG